MPHLENILNHDWGYTIAFDLHLPNTQNANPVNEPPHEKTKAQISYTITAKLISAFVFATRIVQFLFFLNLKFPAFNHLLCLYSSVSGGPVRKPHCWFSHDTAQNVILYFPERSVVCVSVRCCKVLFNSGTRL